MHLAPIDWIIIAVYLAGCMAAGIWMRRFVRGVEDFAIAGRAMDLNLGIASLAATELGLVTVMYTAQLGFTHGFAGATVGVLMAAAMYFVGCTGFIIGPLRRAGVMTIPELFQRRFGTKVRWLAGLFVVLGGVLNMGIFLRLGGEFLVAVTGMKASWLEWVMTALLGMILIYLASVFTLLVAGLYWRRATASGAYAALVLGAIGPITFLVVNVLAVKAGQLAAHPPVMLSFAQ